MRYIRTEIWVIAQALAKKYQGLKTNDMNQRSGMYFDSEEDARTYLKNVILRRKQEIRLGIRNIDNLNPETYLDFGVCRAYIFVEAYKMLKKNWNFKENVIQ